LEQTQSLSSRNLLGFAL
ncbi:hypothetical protein D039_1312B, partial [Vibrio parahaemolyticus EKP-028]